jgi:hypothetical protein
MSVLSEIVVPKHAPFEYTARDPELGEDQTWVCVDDRTGHVSIDDEKKFGSKDDLIITVDDNGIDESVVMLLRIKGKSTYKIKDEIKSLANDDRVDDVYWVADLSSWAIVSKNPDAIHSLVIGIRTFLHACIVVRLKLTYEKRVQPLKEAREKKRRSNVETKNAV